MNNHKLNSISINKKIKTLITENIHIIYVCMYSLNTYNNILKIQTNNSHYKKYIVKNNYNQYKKLIKNYYHTIAFTYVFIIYILCQKSLHKQANFILKEIANNQQNINTCSIITKNYLKKFHYNYIKNTNIYILGHKSYKNKQLIQILSIISLLVISQTYNRYSANYLLLHLLL